MQLDAGVWDGLSHGVHDPARDLSGRRQLDFQAHRIAAGSHWEGQTATLLQKTLAAFALKIFVHEEIGDWPEARGSIVRGVGAGFYGFDAKMPLGISGGRIGDLPGLDQVYGNAGDIDAVQGVDYVALHRLRGDGGRGQGEC